MKRFVCMLLFSVMVCSGYGQVSKAKKMADAAVRVGKVTSAASSNIPKPIPNPYVQKRNVLQPSAYPSLPFSLVHNVALHSVNVNQELLKSQQLLDVRPNQDSLCMKKDSIAAIKEQYHDFCLKMDSIKQALTKTPPIHNDE